MFSAKLLSEVILKIQNNDILRAPNINTTDKYVGYFENAHGQQWIFVGNRETLNAYVYGSSLEWKPFKVSVSNPNPSILMHRSEISWLVSCLCALGNESEDTIRERMGKTAEEQIREMFKLVG